MFLTTKMRNSFRKKPATILCDHMNDNAEFEDCGVNQKAVAWYWSYMVLDFVTHFFVKTPILPPIFDREPSNCERFQHYSGCTCFWGPICKAIGIPTVFKWRLWKKNWLKVPWNSNVGLNLDSVLYISYPHILPRSKLNVHLLLCVFLL